MIQIYFYSDRARRVCAWAVKGICLLLLGVLGRAQDQHPDLTQLTLEQLSKLEVTSVSRKKQQINDVAAAVYVITQRTSTVPGRAIFPTCSAWYPAWMWRRSQPTPGPSVFAASVTSLRTKYWC